MTDGTSLRDDPLLNQVQPGHLLLAEEVDRIVDTIPDRMHRSFLINHMRAAEKFAYEAGVLAGKGIKQ